MLITLIFLFSFVNGNLSITTNPPLDKILLPEIFLSTTMDTGFAFYTDVLRIDTTTSIWVLNSEMDTIKEPVLDAMSIKLKDSLSYIGISYLSPIMDTSHTIFFSFSTKTSNHKFLKNYYLGGIKMGKKQKHLTLLVFYTNPSIYLFGINTRIGRWKFSLSPVLYHNSSIITNSSATFSTGKFKSGLFIISYPNSTLFGPVFGIRTQNLKATIKTPFTYRKILLDFNLKYRNLSFIALSKMLYNTTKDTLTHFQLFRASYSSKLINIDTWYKKLQKSEIYGADFVLTPTTWLYTGYTILKDTLSMDLYPILGLKASFYDGELKNHTFLEFKNFRELYYGVEFLLFRNLILRIKKNNYTDFIGIFVRLLN